MRPARRRRDFFRAIRSSWTRRRHAETHAVVLEVRKCDIAVAFASFFARRRTTAVTNASSPAYASARWRKKIARLVFSRLLLASRETLATRRIAFAAFGDETRRPRVRVARARSPRRAIVPTTRRRFDRVVSRSTGTLMPTQRFPSDARLARASSVANRHAVAARCTTTAAACASARSNARLRRFECSAATVHARIVVRRFSSRRLSLIRARRSRRARGRSETPDHRANADFRRARRLCSRARCRLSRLFHSTSATSRHPRNANRRDASCLCRAATRRSASRAGSFILGSRAHLLPTHRRVVVSIANRTAAASARTAATRSTHDEKREKTQRRDACASARRSTTLSRTSSRPATSPPLREASRVESSRIASPPPIAPSPTPSRWCAIGS